VTERYLDYAGRADRLAMYDQETYFEGLIAFLRELPPSALGPEVEGS